MHEDAWPDPDLKPLPVDLEQLADALEGDPLLCGGIIDLDTGEVWPNQLMDLLSDDEGIDWDEKVENRLVIDDLGSRGASQDMCDFISDLPDGTLARRLDHAIGGRGAFRRFKDVLADHPAEWESYHRFAHTRKIDRAAAWLADCGYQAVTTQNGN